MTSKLLSNPRALVRAATVLAFFLISPAAFAQGSPNLVISQVYGGGGNAGAIYKNDFIEIFNRGATAVSLAGMSLQYGSTTGNLGGSNLTPLPSVMLQSGQYFLVREAAGAGGTTDLPAPDVTTGSIAMSATGGKVALVNSTASLSCNSPASCAPVASLIVDLVGYDGATFFEGSGAAPALTSTTAAFRNGTGCNDTDDNRNDFSAGPPVPRNSASAFKSCNSAQPTSPSASGSASPASVSAGDTSTLSVTVTPGTNPDSTGLAVSGDLSSVGGSSTQAFTGSGGGIFSFVATVSAGTTAGSKSIPVVVTDAQSRSGNATISLTVTAPVPRFAIHDIQGSTTFSPLAGLVVETEGIVTGVKSNGYFIQAPDSEIDGDVRTSEGIFVFTSSAAPAAAVVGNRVRVRARVQDFIPSADPASPPVTELSSVVSTTALSSGNAMPAAIHLSAADLDPAGSLGQLAKYEGMRVQVDTLNVVAPTGGTISEPSATSTSNGTFYGVLPGTPRPFREPGIAVPTVAPAGVPQFDANPELLRVDSDGQLGAVRLDVATGAVVANLTGVLDFGFRAYTLDPDPGTLPIVTNNDAHAIPVRPAAAEGEIAIASFNMERFYDTVNDPGTSDAILTAAGFERRLSKASLVIRNVLQMPDVIGVEEMENLTTLQTLAARIDADAIAAGQVPPGYVAYLEEGNDIGGIDVGLLVKPGRIDVLSVVQQGKDTLFVQPDGTTALLNDRPPLVMTASVNPTGKELPFSMTVIVNHLRSLSGIDDPVDGLRVQQKRLAQAEFLAGLINGAQHQVSGQNVISVGDYNAFDVNDGYVDVINTVRGGPPHPGADLVGEPGQLVDTPLIDLAPADPAQHYSYVFDGNAQVLDHIIVSQSLVVNDFTYARNDADFPESLRADATRPERISDHDMPVAYFAVPRDTVAPSVAVTGVSEGGIYRLGAVPPAGCSTTDDASGVRTPAALQITGGNADGTGSFTATCSGAVDNVGNAASDVSVHYAVDGLAPAVAVTGVTEGAFYRLGAVPAAACVTTDDLAGVATPATLAITGGNADGTGSFTATCSGAVDNVGNAAADVSVHYFVDGLAPTVTVTGVAEGAFYRLGAVPPAGCITIDDASGVRTPATLLITGGNAGGTGSFTATCTGAVDNVGNTAADVSVHYTVDGLPPLVVVTGVTEGAVYRAGAVPLTGCVTIDDASGVRTPAFLQVTGGRSDGTGFFTATCTGAVDNVGNAAADVSVHYAVDGAPPVVTVTGVTNGATYLLGAVPAAGCTTVDDLSGVGTPATLVISGGDFNGIGSITATCRGAVDNVGNVAASISVRYTVVAYSFVFRPPLGPGVKIVKGGSVVEVNFQIRDWTGKLITDTAVVSRIEFAPNPSCSGTPASGWRAAAAARGTRLRFDREEKQFEFDWKTSGLAEGCYSIAVRTIDTLRHSALVAIRDHEHGHDDDD